VGSSRSLASKRMRGDQEAFSAIDTANGSILFTAPPAPTPCRPREGGAAVDFRATGGDHGAVRGCRRSVPPTTCSMRQYPLIALAALLGAACAPVAPAASPTPAPTAPVPRAAPTLETVPTSAPDGWWLLDPETDGVRGLGVRRAYSEALVGRTPQRTVVVAVIDSGVDVEHEDLAGSLWANAGEVAGTGRDDDGNGYVDDVHGWNFIGGPDGRNVDADTYEVTRIYAELRPIFEGARADTLDAAAREEFERYRRIRAEWQTERARANRELQQIRQIEQAVDQLTAMLRAHLGTDTLGVEAVRGIRTTRPDLQRAQGIFLQMAADNVTPDLIRRQREYYERRVNYGLDPEFDPRPIVGDRPDDYAERFYGNADVVGPDASHGTHVAGIIAAGRDNGLGIDGIAPARIMVVRAVPNGDERDKDVANAIRYAVDNGADIINMSFGKAHSPGKRYVDEAVRYADERGVLLVHAAGNDGADLGDRVSYPNRNYQDGGSARHWITVGASAWWSADSLAAPFSNHGRQQVDVFAPGVDITSTVPGNRYEANSGTSMAAPMVSGVAALLMAYYPSLSTDEVRDIIIQSARRYDGRRVLRPGGRSRVEFCELATSCGIVDAYEAVRLAETRAAARAAAAD
jgi:subtilisin family serine protease